MCTVVFNVRVGVTIISPGAEVCDPCSVTVLKLLFIIMYMCIHCLFRVVIAAIVDGQWGKWTKWGECSQPCGVGKQHRRRVCNDPPPMNGGLDCVGSTKDMRLCDCDPNFNASGELNNYTLAINWFWSLLCFTIQL